jgi:hypothetical protein
MPGGKPRRFMVVWESVIVSPARAVGGKSRPATPIVGRGAYKLRQFAARVKGHGF